jgi:hypothetical protein
MPRTNSEEIYRIIKLGTLTVDNVWQVFELKRDASIPEVINAFKRIAMQVHPDKNPTLLDQATTAFTILNQAKKLATSAPNKTGPSVASDPFSEQFNQMFDPENRWMKGPLVRKMRDIMLSFAGIFYRKLDIPNGDAARVRSYFVHLTLPQPRDAKILAEYADLLFPDVFVSSDKIAKAFNSRGLKDVIEVLHLLSCRYPELNEAANRLLENELDVKFEEFVGAFEGIKVRQIGRKFTNFLEFSKAFLGISDENPVTFVSEEQKLTESSPYIAAGYAFLDDYCIKHASLLEQAVAIADRLRSIPNLTSPFVYSETQLELDPIRAQFINKLSVSPQGLPVTRKAILEAQFKRFIASILGDQQQLSFLDEFSFPKEQNEIRCDVVLEPSSGYQFTHVFTGEVFLDQKSVQGKYPWFQLSHFGKSNKPIVPILPPRGENLSFIGAFAKSKANMLDFLDKYYGVTYCDFNPTERNDRPTTIVKQVKSLIGTSYLESAEENTFDECKQQYDRLVQVIYKKNQELIDKGTESHPSYDPSYVKAKAAALTLNEKLIDLASRFFSKPTPETFTAFRAQCFTAISNAEIVLKEHRGTWQQLHPLIKGIIGVLATLSVIPALCVSLCTKQGYVMTFFERPKTDSMEKLEDFKEKLQQMSL